MLDTIENISGRPFCDFCCLIIAALDARLLLTSLEASDPITNSLSKSLKVYLQTVQAGAYPLESGKLEDVRAIAVYTNEDIGGGDEFRIKTNYALIRLLANDAHYLGQKPLYHGRIIGNHISPMLLWSWISPCRVRHTHCEKVRHRWGIEKLTGPRSLLLIDPINMCLRKRRIWVDIEDYIALSYVWGGQQGLQLLKSNRADLQKPDSLKELWDHIPAAIQDAIELVRGLDPYYYEATTLDGAKIANQHLGLWVDQLCITQDDPVEKAIQIEQMGHIYSDAMTTIIATEGTHSNQALSRLHPDNEATSSEQVVCNIGGLRLAAALPNINVILQTCKWTTRAWTMQEAELSHSVLIFSKKQVYFRCHEEVFQEDVVSEINGEALECATQTDRVWTNSLAVERR